jgi:hypothetical protein
MPDPVNIDDLKVEDVVVTSTPQQRDTPAKEEVKPEPEAKKEEVKVAPSKEPELVKKEDEKPEPETEEEEEKEKEEEAPRPEMDWDAFSEDVGIEITSDEDIVASLKELATYKTLSPALQKAIDIERNNGDVEAYFKSITLNPEKLSDRDALWEQYVAENPKRVADNPKFATLDFNRKIEREYSLLNQYEALPASEQEEFLLEHKAEIDYLKEKRKFEADGARASLQEQRDKATFKDRPDIKQKTEEQLAKIMEGHQIGYKKALSEFDTVALNLGEGFEFNVGLTASNKKVAEEWMKHPEKFLNELGFVEGKIDYDTMIGWAALIADVKYGNFGTRLRQALVDNKDIKTLESTLDAPGIVKTGAEKNILQTDEWEQVGNKFEEMRKARKR